MPRCLHLFDSNLFCSNNVWLPNFSETNTHGDLIFCKMRWSKLFWNLLTFWTLHKWVSNSLFKHISWNRRVTRDALSDLYLFWLCGSEAMRQSVKKNDFFYIALKGTLLCSTQFAQNTDEIFRLMTCTVATKFQLNSSCLDTCAQFFSLKITRGKSFLERFFSWTFVQVWNSSHLACRIFHVPSSKLNDLLAVGTIKK